MTTDPQVMPERELESALSYVEEVAAQEPGSLDVGMLRECRERLDELISDVVYRSA